jgi:ArsR family transcriptional regulator, arsenate/arsenite/antimonite-responsive transcriptional repressor
VRALTDGASSPIKRPRNTYPQLFMDAPHKNSPLLFHALSDPTRLELMKRLKGGKKCVCELTDVMQAAQSRLSFHLRILKRAGLVRDRREGRWKFYSVNKAGLDEVKHLVVEMNGGPDNPTGGSGMCDGFSRKESTDVDEQADPVDERRAISSIPTETQATECLQTLPQSLDAALHGRRRLAGPGPADGDRPGWSRIGDPAGIDGIEVS